MYYLIVLVFTLLIAWVVFKVARRKWREAEIEEIESRVKDTDAVYESAKKINAEKLKKQHDKIEEVKKATDL